MGMYKIELTLTRDMLGTNPLDPHVHDTHVVDRQRKIIAEKSKINAEVNKYLDALEISVEKGEKETAAIVDKLQELTGITFSDEEKKMALAGKLEFLKETFGELDTRGVTVFFWNKELSRPMIGDHMIYGFMKAASEAICRAGARGKGEVLKSSSYTSSIINQHVRLRDQFIAFDKDIVRNADGTPKYNQRSLRAMTAQGPRVSLAKSEVVEAGAKLSFVMNVYPGSPLTEEHIRKIFDYGQFSGLGQWRNAGYGMFTYTMETIEKDLPSKL